MFRNEMMKRTFYKALVLCITFIAYTCYHMGRRPLTIVKNVLNRNCSDVIKLAIYDQDLMDITYIDQLEFPSNSTTWCDWAPFDNDATANQQLALLDSAFLFSYAFFMFFSGLVADRCNIRYFLSLGMLLTGALLYAFGMAFYLNIHSMSYFVIVQILSGAIQTTGWPSVVSCIGNWFDHSSRGAIFGLWNANTNLGNISGAVIAGYFAERSWGLSFMVPGFITMAASVLVFFFLVPKPEDVGLSPIKSLQSNCLDSSDNRSHRDEDIEEALSRISPDVYDNSRANRRKPQRVTQEAQSIVSELEDSQTLVNSEHSPLISSSPEPEIQICDNHSVSFWNCLKIPGVIEYSLCLGFAKLVSYTFLYWLPRYITQSTLNNSEDSAYLSVPFDLGGMFGAIFAGFISDKYRKNGTICTVMLTLAIPSMYAYEKFASRSDVYNIVLQLITGVLVTGPYSLITTAVSTDLGSRVKNGKAMATVASIVDGAGSVGAAIGPLFAGFLSNSGWQVVFMMLMISDLLASLCLTRITLKEAGFRL